MRREREIDKDTVVAYHEYIQGRIQGTLNGIRLGPGKTLCDIATGIFIFAVVSGIVGILVITLRFRHVYLWDWNDKFVGPFFIVLFIICTGVAVLLVSIAHKRTNKYRRHLVFRPIGDYGVAVVHSSRLAYEEATKEELKSGTTPHKSSKPRPYDSHTRTRRLDYENPAYRQPYRDDERGPPPSYDEKPRDDRRGPPRGPDDRRGPPRGPDDRDRRGPPRGSDDRDRRGPPRGPPRGPDDRRGPPRGPPRGPDDRDRRGPPRGPDDRDRRGPPRGPPRGPDDRRGPPRGPDDRGRRPPPTEEERRQYEERRRQEGRRYYDDEPSDREKRPQGAGFKLVPDAEIQFRAPAPARVDLQKELEEDTQI